MYCPMNIDKFARLDTCAKEECAWWDKDYDDGRCIVVTIAKNLDYVADVCDGHRTLFVRNV